MQKFCQTGHCLGKVGISHMTTHDQDGNEVAQPNFPFKFSFKVLLNSRHVKYFQIVAKKILNIFIDSRGQFP